MAEVERRMAAPQPMNVLLQGDVGPGKTLVALHACLVAIQSGHQAAIMAPTEVLAGQHLRSVGALLDRIGGADRYFRPRAAATDKQLLDSSRRAAAPTLTYALLSAASPGKDRARILAAAADGPLDLVIGTHALVQEGVAFADLSPRRRRRAASVRSPPADGAHGQGGGDIDVLIMTATPIPRTLALTYYGDLDVAILDELPPGRQPIRTVAARTEEERAAAEDLVRVEVAAGRQAFVVCAAIDESESHPGEGGRNRGRATAPRRLPQPSGRAAPRPHAARRTRSGSWTRSGRARRTS